MQTIETSIFNVNGDRLQGPLIIGTFEIRAPARLPGPISRNFALGSYEKFQPGFRDEKRQSEDFWREMRERKRTWRNTKIITSVPVIALATLIAVSLQLRSR